MGPRRDGWRSSSRAAIATLLSTLLIAAPSLAQRAAPPGAAYEGPRARLNVLTFELRPPTASALAADGLAEMLGAALAQTNRYLVGERAPADLVVLGVLTELTAPGFAPGEGAEVAMDLRLLDVKTSRVLASGSARGRAKDASGLSPSDRPRLGVGLSVYAGTPLEKAIRQAVVNGARMIAAGTPADYLRHTDAPARAVAAAESGPLPPLTVSQAEPPRPSAPTPPASGAPAPRPPASPPPVAPAPRPARPTAPAPRPASPPNVTPSPPSVPIGMRFVKTPTANLRDSGGTAGKIIQSIPKGTRLEILETRGVWHHVRLPDGKQGWLADSVTSPTPPE